MHPPEVVERYAEAISRLPREPGWSDGTDLYMYQGFWWFHLFLPGIMWTQDHFKARPTDTVLCSPPKSGTTWLKALAFAITTRARYDSSSSPLLTTVPHECVPFLEIDLARDPPERLDPELPLLATHAPYGSLPESILDSDCKIVYIFRDPKDAFVSLWHFWLELFPGSHVSVEHACDLFCEGVNAYGPYWDHVLGFWKASLERPNKVLILKYEDLTRDTKHHVKKLADFLGYSFSLEEENGDAIEKICALCSFENLSNLAVNKVGKHREGSPLPAKNNTYFRKGKIGDWKNLLTVEMAKKIDRVTEQKFGSSGLVM